LDFDNLIEAVVRWAHVLSGAAWVGLLFFFAWVTPAFAAALDPEPRKKALPVLIPRTLWWTRWATAWAFVSGLILLVLVYYKNKDLLFDPESLSEEGKMPGAAHGLLAFVFLSVFLYDFLQKKLLRNDRAMFLAGVLFITGFAFLLSRVGGLSFRGYTIHIGAMLGTFMAFNVWIRIWPAQTKVMAAIRDGEPPDPALVAMAGARLRHNTYMTFPVVFLMLSQHGTWSASRMMGLPMEINIGLIVLVGWAVCWLLYRKAAQVEEQ